MKYIKIYIPAVFLCLALACTKTTGNTDPTPGGPGPVLGVPIVKPAGSAIGEALVRQIGAEGGTIVSEDHVITIDVPAGAVSGLTNFSVQKVENSLDTIHPAYRFTPEGVAFAKPVKITYNYANDSLYGNDPAYFSLVYRDAAGHYFKPTGMGHNAQSKTFTILTMHFSDWNISENYEIHFDQESGADHSQPPHLEANEKVKLFVQPTYGTNDDTSELFLPPLGESDAQQHAEWKIISGPGTIDIPNGNHTIVTYNAPANLTKPTNVLISCTLTGNFGKDNFGNPVKKMILLQTVYLDASFFSISIDGANPMQLMGIGAVDLGYGMAITGQNLAGESFLVSAYGYSPSTYAFDQPPKQGTAYIEMTTLVDIAYHTYYPKDCNGNNDKLTFSNGAVTLSRVGSKAGEYVTGKVEGATVYGTNWCGGSGVKKHTISGKFNIKRKA